MAFQEKIVSLGTTDTLLFECPATLSGSAHGLVFSNLTNTPQPITFKHYCKATGITLNLAQGRAVPANSEIAWPKPINLAAGDQLIALASALNAVTALASIYLATSSPIAAGFTLRGEHSIVATYAVNDIVSKSGSSYIAVAQNVNDVPPSASWMIQAAKGDKGADGVTATAADLGLGNVSNTSDANKPVSTTQATAIAAAQATAIAASAPAAHVGAGGAAHANVVAGGSAGFMTGADKTKLDAVAGTNTGDETLATIKTKLSITTLSGSNTGDQVIPAAASTPPAALGAAAAGAAATFSRSDHVHALPLLAALGAQAALVSGTNIKTVGGASLLGTGDIPMSAANAATLSGNLSPYVTQTTALTVTNYDSATAYSATATGGTVSVSANTITYVAAATAGSFTITVTAGAATRVVPVTVLAAGVVAPGITAPTNGATNIGQAPTITTGVFSAVGAADTHLNTDWEIRTAAGGAGTLIASSLADATNKLSWTMPDSLLAVSTTYYARARHRGTTLGAGTYSEASFTTAAAFTPTVPGTAYQGGFYAGRVTIGGSTYAIIVAPKASGHSTSKTWKATSDTTSGTLSLNDGLTNSNAMNNASHPAAQFCRGLSIGSYTDWYLPSRDELEVCYRALKPTATANTVYASRIANFGAGGNGVDAQGNGDNDNSSPVATAYTTGDPAMTAAIAFQSGGAECFESQYYWASTEFDASYAWMQNFSGGNQHYTTKTNALYVRAVRKILI